MTLGSDEPKTQRKPIRPPYFECVGGNLVMRIKEIPVIETFSAKLSYIAMYPKPFENKGNVTDLVVMGNGEVPEHLKKLAKNILLEHFGEVEFSWEYDHENPKFQSHWFYDKDKRLLHPQTNLKGIVCPEGIKMEGRGNRYLLMSKNMPLIVYKGI